MFVESGVQIVLPPFSVSGTIVQISGQHVFVESGTHVVAESGLGVLISGQHVFVESGVHIASGIYQASGIGVQIQSGAGILISGQYVSVESGIGVLVSGQLTTTSGIGVTIQSGTGVSVQSGLGVVLASGVGVIINSGVGVTVQSGLILLSGWFPAYMLSGLQLASGGSILVSGQGVIVGTATLSGLRLISGQSVTVNSGLQLASGGAVALLSGAAIVGTIDIVVPGTPVINNSGNPITLTSGLSGGVSLWSAVCVSVTVKAMPNNSGVVYVGGYTAGQMPYSGCGFVLAAGEAITVDVNNIGKVKVCTTLSGSQITYIAMAS